MKLIGSSLISETPKSEINGCGGKGYGWLIPDRLFLVDFSKACNIHDCYYYWIKQIKAGCTYLPGEVRWLANVPAEKARCIADKIFLENMELINRIKSSNSIGYYARMPLIKLYYYSVRKYGKGYT